MASNGLNNRAVNGTCRVCQRVRNTNNYLKAVGEVHHGFATGHVWECVNTEDCDKVAYAQLNNSRCVEKARIKNALEKGRFKEYVIFT